MPAILDRTKLSRGPAEIAYTTGGQTAYYLSVGDVTFDPGLATKKLDSAAFGTVKTIRSGVKPTVSFDPLGMLRDLAITFPHAAMTPGHSLVGAYSGNPAVYADNTLVVRPLDQSQKKTTLYGAGISKVPDLNFTGQAQIFSGAMTFAIAGKNAVAADAANRLLLREANDLDHPHYDPATLFAQVYDVTCALFNNGNPLATVGGIKVAFNLATTDKGADGLLYDMSFKSIDPTASFQPLGISEDDLLAALALQGAGSAIGKSVNDAGADLVISAPGAYCKLPVAGISKASLIYGADAERVGVLDMVAGVQVDANGVPTPRFVLALAAPQ